MKFSSILFIYVILPLIVAIYYIIPKKHKEKALFGISLFFIFTFGFSILTTVCIFVLPNYLLCRLIGRAVKKKWLCMSLFVFDFALNVAYGIFCKHFIMNDIVFFEDFSGQLTFIGTVFLVMSAIGIADEVRQGEVAEKNFIKFGLYIVYFPKFIAGPYISYKSFSENLSEAEKGLEVLGNGASAFVKGLAKKVIIADSIFQLWHSVNMLDISSISVLTAWLGILAFGLSFYFTLSGITDMARGISLIFGINLPKSFRYPIFSTSMTEFCDHWHMSLTQWLKMYIYRPTEKFSYNRIINAVKLILMWCCVGIMYEYTLNKLIWGLIIALSLIVEKILSKRYFGKMSSFLYAFLATNIGWIFFMEDNPINSLKFLKAVTGGTGNIADITGVYFLRSYALILLIGIYFSTDLFKNLIERSRGRKHIETAVSIMSPFVLTALLAVSTVLITYN